MKVLLVTTHLNPGGITSYTLSLASALEERGCQVLLASGGGQLADKFPSTHFNVGIDTKCEVGLKVLMGSVKMRQVIRSNQIDLVHAQTRVAAMTSFISTRREKIPFLTTAHGFFRPHLGRRLFGCWGEGVIAISTQVQEHLKRDFHVKPEKIHLIYNGTNHTRYETKLPADERKRKIRQIGFDPDMPLIGIVARLSPVKGHTYLMKALYELKKEMNVQCLVVGDGPSREAFLKEMNELNLQDTVRWIRWVEDPKEVLDLLDIFVLPSLQEGLSLSILEAQAAAIPVVASNVGGISEVVEDKQTGILVPPQNPGALKQALKELLQDLEKARQMGIKGKEHIKNQFSLGRMANQVIQVYDEILKSFDRKHGGLNHG